MKNAPTTNSSESALDKREYTIGILPKRQNTVRAAVLAATLEGESLTGMDAVFGQNTTRLAAHIQALEDKYGWRFYRHDFLVNTKDGRSVWIVAYYLPPTVIKLAAEDGAHNWIEEVKVARAKLKQGAAKHKQKPAQAYTIRTHLRNYDPHQLALWGDL